MKKFLFKIIILFLIMFALDRSLGRLADHYFFKTRDGDTGGQINGLLEKKAPILVFGSSRAEGQYVPDVLGKSLGGEAFNAGFKGSSSLYDYALLRLVLEHYTPSLIIYDFSVQTINKSEDPYSKLYPLYPFRSSPSVWELLKKRSRLEPLFFFSRLYPYNSKLHSVMMFNIWKNRPGASNGYFPQRSVMRPVPLEEPDRKEAGERDPLLVDYYKQFIQLAKERGIKVVVVCSPRYSTGAYDIPQDLIRYLEEMSVPFFDFDLNGYPQFSDHKLYKDLDHLNDVGAEIFSELLGQKIGALQFIPALPASTP
ncbi:MAG TPA: hypothetical protein P5246_06365 [Candidatus Omnitrophota bacterium]|nr:hypothetical protein [Candidatus Omnitrophota bacterium]HSA31964.1 hypothetical protein [Candidatus Omnitrophota bacterium]